MTSRTLYERIVSDRLPFFDPDPQQDRIAELVAENAKLRKELKKWREARAKERDFWRYKAKAQ